MILHSSNKPNILVIMSDQHSKRQLGCYGNSIIRTPNIDRLATEGMRFTNTYCPSPLCVPSRMSFMTSCNPSKNEVWDNNQLLHSRMPTWATLLTLNGYETALLGRMHFCGPDQRHGFEVRPVGERRAGLVGMIPKGGPMWTKYPGATAGQTRRGVEIAGRGHTHYQWSDEERTRVAVRWLEEKSKMKGGRPFAAVLGYSLPHCPYIAKPELFNYYYDRVDIPKAEENQPKTVQSFRQARGILEPPLSEERVRVARAAYFGLCEHIDSLIGQVIDTLEKTGLAENTVVIYVSDHGEMAGEHGCWWKSNYYEESASVPFVIRWPGVVPMGATSNYVCNLMDIGPTLVDIAGSQFPYPVDGKSLKKILTTGKDDEWVNETFCELVDVQDGYLPSRMIRSDNWKLWVCPDHRNMPPVLFDLEKDPEEKVDLAQDKAYSGIVERLTDAIYTDWYPNENARKSKEFDLYFNVLWKWGQTTDPDAPDALIYPDASYENDIELV